MPVLLSALLTVKLDASMKWISLRFYSQVFAWQHKHFWDSQWDHLSFFPYKAWPLSKICIQPSQLILFVLSDGPMKFVFLFGFLGRLVSSCLCLLELGWVGSHDQSLYRVLPDNKTHVVNHVALHVTFNHLILMWLHQDWMFRIVPNFLVNLNRQVNGA